MTTCPTVFIQYFHKESLFASHGSVWFIYLLHCAIGSPPLQLAQCSREKICCITRWLHSYQQWLVFHLDPPKKAYTTGEGMESCCQRLPCLTVSGWKTKITFCPSSSAQGLAQRGYGSHQCCSWLFLLLHSLGPIGLQFLCLGATMWTVLADELEAEVLYITSGLEHLNTWGPERSLPSSSTTSNVWEDGYSVSLGLWGTAVSRGPPSKKILWWAHSVIHK